MIYKQHIIKYNRICSINIERYKKEIFIYKINHEYKNDKIDLLLRFCSLD